MSIAEPNQPQVKWPVHGHEWAVEYLQRVVAAESLGADDAGSAGERRLRHAYLFLGSPQVGKSTFVRAFAKALHCTCVDEAGAGSPCGICRSCRLMEKERHPDFRVVAPTDTEGQHDRLNGLLRVEQANDFVHEVALRPVESRYKVFHLQDAQRARTEFSNKVLKTLEEPPDHTVICLTATDRSELLPTIVSRCQVLELRPIPAVTIRNALIDHWHVDDAQAELLSRISGGRMGWAVRQLDDKSGAQQRLEMLDELRRLIPSNRLERLSFAEKSSSKRNNQRLFGMLELWVTWWRDVLLTQNGCAESISNIDRKDDIAFCAEAVASISIQRHLATLKQVERYLHHTVNTRLALDALLLDIPRPGE